MVTTQKYKINTMGMSRSEITYCYKCGCEIRWSDNVPEDNRFGGAIDKLRDHWKDDISCKRGEKLKELFGEVTKKDAQMFWEERTIS
jgi:hypothetical protein